VKPALTPEDRALATVAWFCSLTAAAAVYVLFAAGVVLVAILVKE